MRIDFSEQQSVRNILIDLRERAFEEQLALALGRPEEEMQSIVDGAEPLDEDLEMKARELAGHRAFNFEAAPD